MSGAFTVVVQIAMGGWLSYVWWGGDPDAAHAQTGLSRREVCAVQRSWARVYAQPVDNGIELLKRFFRAYPETKEFFKMIRNVPEEELASNMRLKVVITNLMNFMNLAIQNLNQPEVVVAMMQNLGETHRKMRIKESHFHDLEGVLMKMFTELLRLDEPTLAAWKKNIAFWYKHIFETLNAVER